MGDMRLFYAAMAIGAGLTLGALGASSALRLGVVALDRAMSWISPAAADDAEDETSCVPAVWRRS